MCYERGSAFAGTLYSQELASLCGQAGSTKQHYVPEKGVQVDCLAIAIGKTADAKN